MKRYMIAIILTLLIVGGAWADRAAVTGNVQHKGNSGFDVKSYGATGDGSTDDRAAINTAHTAATANGGRLIFPSGNSNSTYKISSSITFDSDVTLVFLPGAKLSVDNTFTATINGYIADTTHQIFTGAGSIGGQPLNEFVRPEWWGAVHDGATDASTAIQAALDFATASTVGMVKFFGQYIIESALTLTTKENFSLVGSPAATTQTSSIATEFVFNNISTSVHALDLDNCNSFSIEGIRFFTTGTKAKSGLHLDGTTGITYSARIENCTFRNFTDSGMHVTGGSGVFYIQVLNVHSTVNDWGFQSTGVINSFWFLGGRFDNNGTGGFNIGPAQNMVFDGVDLEGQSEGITSPAGSLKKGWSIRNCYFEQGGASTTHAISLGNLNNSVIGPVYMAGDLDNPDLILNTWCNDVTVINWPFDVTIEGAAYTDNITLINVAGTITDNTGKEGAVSVLNEGTAVLGGLKVMDRTSLGSDLVTNGAFTSDTTGWTATTATLSSVASGQSGNCLQVANNSGRGQARQTVTVVVGEFYEIVYYHNGSGASNPITGRVSVDSAAYQTASGDYVYESSLSESSWANAKTYYVKALTTSMYINLMVNSAAGVENTLFDTISVKQVTGGDATIANDLTVNGDGKFVGALASGPPTTHTLTLSGFTAAEAKDGNITSIINSDPTITFLECYISNDPTGDEDIVFTLGLYRTDTHDPEDLIVEYTFNITYTETNGGVGDTDTTDTVDTTAGLTKGDYVLWQEDTEYARLTAVPTATGITFSAAASGTKADNTGLVRVTRIQNNLKYEDSDESDEIHIKGTTGSAPTGSMNVLITVGVQ